MNKQKGYYNFDFTGFIILLLVFGVILGVFLSWISPIVWTYVIKPLLLALV